MSSLYRLTPSGRGRYEHRRRSQDADENNVVRPFNEVF
jgi:hypothetical protein